MIKYKGFTLRASYLIDLKGVLRRITINDLHIGHSVNEALLELTVRRSTDQHTWAGTCRDEADVNVMGTV